MNEDMARVQSEHNNTGPREKVYYDQLLISAGEFGPYQIYLFLYSCPFYIFGTFMYFSQIFLTEVSPNHWCWIPELANMTINERRALSIPLDKDGQFGYSRCTSYVANWTEVLNTGQKPDGSWGRQACQHGWEFNKSEIPYSTISSELGWVCERSSYQATAQSLFFVGSIIGGFLVGWIADRFGRLAASVSANIIGCLAGVASIFARDFVEFAVCRIFMGMSYDNCMIMTYLLMLEYTAPKYRTRMANLSFAIFYTLGVSTLPWIALACGDWKLFSLVTSLPLALSILAPLIIPESPRWLLSKGRIDDAVNHVLTVGRKNKKKVPMEIIEQFKITLHNNDTVNGSLWDLLKRPLLRRMFLCMCLLEFCCMIIFDSLVRAIGSLRYDFLLSFSVLSFTEFPSLLLFSFIFDLTGRRWLVFIVSMFSGIFSFITPFVGGGLPSVFCALVVRFAANMACNSATQWIAEMLPSPVRGRGTSVVHICGYIAFVTSQFIAYLNIYKAWLPLVIVGIISLFNGFLSLTLPETVNKAMPQTFDDAENVMRGQKIWDIPCVKNRVGVKNDQC